MTFLNVIILSLSLIVDVSFSMRLGAVTLTPHLSTLFLLYLGFRRPFSQCFVAVVVFVILSHPFTSLGFAEIALCYWAVLYTICRLRRKMFAESYVTHAAWVGLFSWLLQWILDLEVRGFSFIRVAAWRAVELSVNSFVMMLITVPLFLCWDALYGSVRIRTRRRAVEL